MKINGLFKAATNGSQVHAIRVIRGCLCSFQVIASGQMDVMTRDGIRICPVERFLSELAA
jgi:hypothetical protein